MKSTLSQRTNSDILRINKQAVLLKQDNGPIPLVAFFGVTLRFLDLPTEDEYFPVHFQHRDIFNERIFLIAVTDESCQTSDIYSVFLNKKWFTELYDRFIREERVFASSSPMFLPGY